MSAADERETESEVGSVREALNGNRHKSTETSTLPAFPILRNAGKDKRIISEFFLGFLFSRG